MAHRRRLAVRDPEKLKATIFALTRNEAHVLALNAAHVLRLNKADVLALNKAHVLRLNIKICPVLTANTDGRRPPPQKETCLFETQDMRCVES